MIEAQIITDSHRSVLLHRDEDGFVVYDAHVYWNSLLFSGRMQGQVTVDYYIRNLLDQIASISKYIHIANVYIN